MLCLTTPQIEWFEIKAYLTVQEDAKRLSPSWQVINDFNIWARWLPSPGKSELAMVIKETVHIETSMLECYEQPETAVGNRDVHQFITDWMDGAGLSSSADQAIKINVFDLQLQTIWIAILLLQISRRYKLCFQMTSFSTGKYSVNANEMFCENIIISGKNTAQILRKTKSSNHDIAFLHQKPGF